MTNTTPHRDPVLYVIPCGSPAAGGVYDFIGSTQHQGWQVCVVPTPMGSRFLDQPRLESLTGFPVRTGYKQPDEADLLPLADAFVVAPATFNTVNKLAQGITDTLAVGLVCEGIGSGRPVFVAPWLNRALASHGAYRRSLRHLREGGVHLLLGEGMDPEVDAVTNKDPTFPWADLVSRLQSLQLGQTPDARST